ncbi:MAG: asparagine synthase-related protein [Moorellales bacterium]
MKKEAAVALVGEGADEVFGGYPWFRRPDALAADTFPWALSLSLRRAVLAPELDRKLRLEEYVAERYRQALAEVPRLPGEDPEAARRREIAYLSLTRFLPVLLERMDRMSMAVGLEIRVPYCDHRLVNYAWNLPWELKAFGGEMKGILRRALKGLLPPEILSRRKSPYPKTYDPQYFASVRAALLEALEDPASPLRPLLNLDTVRELGTAGDTPLPWFGQLMTAPQVLAYLWQVDRWLRDYRLRLRLE